MSWPPWTAAANLTGCWRKAHEALNDCKVRQKMADEMIPPAGAVGEPPANGQGPAVALQTVYIKDLSF